MKLTKKQKDEITKLCDKWRDCVPEDISNGELMFAVSVFIGTFVFDNVEDTEILDYGLMEILMDAKRAYNIYNKEKQL
jgi:hypothetical protein